MKSKELVHRFQYVKDTTTIEAMRLTAVGNKKYGRVSLCIEANMNIPIAEIKLYDTGRAVDADTCFSSAYELAQEIAERWNMFSRKGV